MPSIHTMPFLSRDLIVDLTSCSDHPLVKEGKRLLSALYERQTQALKIYSDQHSGSGWHRIQSLRSVSLDLL